MGRDEKTGVGQLVGLPLINSLVFRTQPSKGNYVVPRRMLQMCCITHLDTNMGACVLYPEKQACMPLKHLSLLRTSKFNVM